MPPTRWILTVMAATALLLLSPTEGSPQTATTGKISGIVLDQDGKPLPNTNVLVRELGQGRIADGAGRYEFDAIPPGAYTVDAKLISYETQSVEAIVEAGRTQRVDFRLRETIAATLPEYEIVEDKVDQLKKEESTTIRVIDTKEASKIRAINTTEEAIATQAGVVQLGDQFFVRGGRSSEVKTVVDGMPVSDAFAGSAGEGGTLDIALTSQEGVNLLSGGLDAEYGNALSGIIEIPTREGGEEYQGTVRFLTDDFGAPDKTYFNYDNISFGFGGPVPFAGDAWRFFASGEGVFEDTYLKTLEERPSKKLLFNDMELASLRDRQENATRGQGKVTYRFTGGRKISGEYLFSRSNNDWYHHSFSRVGFFSQDAADARDPDRPAWWFEPLDSTYTYYNGPEHLSELTTRNDQYKLVYTHPLTSDSYITSRVALFRTRYKEAVGNKRPEEYVSFTGNDVERDPANLFYAVVGDYPIWEERESKQYTFRGDYQNKLGAGTHELKTGVTFDYFDLRKSALRFPTEDDPDGNFPNQYEENAWGSVFYVQDKLRYQKTMVMNAGLRLDVFDPGENSIRVSNQRVLTLEKPTSGTSLFERWKAQVSPRLGMSYPISDRDVLHFHYGRFFQLPDLELLYDYSQNATSPQTVGNAFLEPETTISYEFGVRRQLSETIYLDATVFFKDIFGLVGVQQLEAEREQEANEFAPSTYYNQDYGSVRGFELSLDKKFSSYWQGQISYTLSRATGSSSDVNQGLVVIQEGQDREPIREIPLDWDRTHVLSGFLAFSDPGIWQVSVDLNLSSGSPETPLRLGQRTTQAEEINTIRLPGIMTVNLKAQKLYELYGQEFRLFLEGRNVLDRRNVRGLQPFLYPTPDQEYYQQYYTEYGELGGAYNLKDTIGLNEDVLIPLNDPRVWGEPRVFRFGIQFEF
jgi:outer membrane receptor protein involved in Fe transport